MEENCFFPKTLFLTFQKIIFILQRFWWFLVANFFSVEVRRMNKKTLLPSYIDKDKDLQKKLDQAYRFKSWIGQQMINQSYSELLSRFAKWMQNILGYYDRGKIQVANMKLIYWPVRSSITRRGGYGVNGVDVGYRYLSPLRVSLQK